MVYEKMAVQQGSDRQPLYSFWDKKCLNFGQNWETGFLNALLKSRVIAGFKQGVYHLLVLLHWF
jgi:hypothetical protein